MVMKILHCSAHQQQAASQPATSQPSTFSGSQIQRIYYATGQEAVASKRSRLKSDASRKKLKRKLWKLLPPQDRKRTEEMRTQPSFVPDSFSKEVH
ncbi:uncharacterized protein LOC143841223 isoform X3 [Paroedura picta]|uniref:uncharacterized protein LOC143841223 isoform X3 n=1 Tax=Paroedura picta TaxID=143630 RepID=UPI004055EAD4